MRRQAREREGVVKTSSEELAADGVETSQRHINFFADLQHGVSTKSLALMAEACYYNFLSSFRWECRQ